MVMHQNFRGQLLFHTIIFIFIISTFTNAVGVEVSGIQSGVWRFSDSPYIITGDIQILQGMTLTIEPGVVAKFSRNTGIRVEGTLVALGRNGRRIVFTSINDNEFGTTDQMSTILPTKQDWMGILFSASSGSSSKMDYCIVRYSQAGVSAANAKPLLSHIIFADCSNKQIIINGRPVAIEPGVELDYNNAADVAAPVALSETSVSQTGSEAKAETDTSSVAPTNEILSSDEFSFGEITVVSASRREQSLAEAPAAITVITAEDIMYSGAVTIPDVLRMVPGLDVMTITASDISVNARGYNKEMANKMLVLIDGRYANWDFYGTTLWDSFPLNLTDISRIEVIRGPGSSLYGANAFSGVINIITKSPEEASGTHFSATGGQLGTYLGSFTQAGSSEKFGYKLTMGVDKTNQWQDKSKPSRDQKKGTLLLEYKANDHSRLAVEGGVNDGIGEALTGIGRMDRQQTVGHVKMDFSNRNFSASAFWYRTEADIVQNPTLKKFHFLSNTVDLESHLLFDLGSKNALVLGGNYRLKLAESNIIDKNHQQEFSSAFFEDQFKVTDKLAFTLGLRYDRQPLIDPQLTPRASMVFSPLKDRYLRFSYGTAFRAPAFIESYLYEDTDIGKLISPLLPNNLVVVNSRGNLNLRPEKITSYEIGYQSYIFSKFRFRTDMFYDELIDFISFKTISFKDISPMLGYPSGSVVVPSQKSYTNAGKSDAIGGEIGFDLMAAEWLLLTGNYSYQNLTWQEDDPGTPENEKGRQIKTSPKNKINAGIRFKFKSGFSANFMIHYIGKTEKNETWAYGQVPQFTLVNARLGYRFFNGRVEIAVAAYNLFNKKHYEYPGFDKQGVANAGHEIGSRITAAFLNYNF